MRGMKKRLLAVCVVCGICILTGCGNEKAQGRIKTGEEIAVEQKENAEQAVEQNNAAVEEMQEQADSIDAE